MNSVCKPLFVAVTLFLFAASLPAADTAVPPVQPHTQSATEHAEAIQQRWYLSGLIVFLLGAGIVYRLKFRRQLA